MASHRTATRLVGTFFLVSNVAFILGAVIFLEPILSATDPLAIMSANRAKIILGALLELINAFAYLGIAVLVFPILRRRYESLALGYVAFRILEFVMQILADMSPLALLSLSDTLVGSASLDASSFQAAGMSLLAMREWAFQMISITFGSGALVFYSMLYNTKLIPRFISIWGLIGAAVVLLNTLAEMFGVSLPNLGFLMLLNELFLGVWLIVRGFSKPAVDALYASGE